MGKIKQFGVIFFVIVIFLSAGIMAIMLGSRSLHTHYVCLEINPRIEFLTDSKHNIISFKPLNQEAKEICILEDFKGENISDAVTKFLSLCAQSGYLKVNGENNAIKLSVLAGLNQGLEVELFRKVNKFLVDHEIMGVIVDSSQDLANFKSAKKVGVSAEKYDLMMAVMENDNTLNLADLKKFSAQDLIKKIAKQHENYTFTYTAEELENKVKLIDFNRVEYSSHMAKITPHSTREFRENLQKFVKQNAKKYKVDFISQYEQWLYN